MEDNHSLVALRWPDLRPTAFYFEIAQSENALFFIKH